ncbi:MAG: hypothetical protein HY319_12505 [Armatimonadetes bacterium]|nr:hypothetical protein [Armatimonadota bacterium]
MYLDDAGQGHVLAVEPPASGALDRFVLADVQGYVADEELFAVGVDDAGAGRIGLKNAQVFRSVSVGDDMSRANRTLGTGVRLKLKLEADVRDCGA